MSITATLVGPNVARTVCHGKHILKEIVAIKLESVCLAV